MKKIFYLVAAIFLATVVLAACGGDPEATATPEPPTPHTDSRAHCHTDSRAHCHTDSRAHCHTDCRPDISPHPRTHS